MRKSSAFCSSSVDTVKTVLLSRRLQLIAITPLIFNFEWRKERKILNLQSMPNIHLHLLTLSLHWFAGLCPANVTCYQSQCSSICNINTSFVLKCQHQMAIRHNSTNTSLSASLHFQASFTEALQSWWFQWMTLLHVVCLFKWLSMWRLCWWGLLFLTDTKYQCKHDPLPWPGHNVLFHHTTLSSTLRYHVVMVRI